jgi:hypothetical protein
MDAGLDLEFVPKPVQQNRVWVAPRVYPFLRSPLPTRVLSQSLLSFGAFPLGAPLD